MKRIIRVILNKHYQLFLAKPKHRQRLNSFLYFFLWKLVYRFHALRKTDEKLVLFVANNDSTMSKDFSSLYETAKAKGYNCVCLCKFKSGSSVAYKNELSKIKADLVFQKYYARAKVTFLSDYYLPAYANGPRKGSRLVQLWHGCGAFKKWGYSLKDASWGLSAELLKKYRVHKNYTDIVVSSPDIAEHYAEAFDVDREIVTALGTPRTDVYFDEGFVRSQKDVLLGIHPELEGKKLILWAPTFRGESFNKSYADKAIDFIKLKEALDENTVLLIKLHPHTAKSFEFSAEEKAELGSFVCNISNDVSIDTALCSADVVIADYSSLIFEYALLKRPMVFFAYDLDDYEEQRSFYYDYASLVPGKIAKTTDELVKLLKETESYDLGCLDSFLQKFMSSCDGHSTERVFEKLVEGKS